MDPFVVVVCAAIVGVRVGYKRAVPLSFISLVDTCCKYSSLMLRALH